MEDDPLAEFQPPPTPFTRAVGLFLRVWTRVVSPAGARLIAPVLAAVAVYVLWYCWRLAGRNALGRALRWHGVFTLVALTAGVAVYLLAAPPEDPTDAAAARAFASEGVGRPVYPEALIVAGAFVVALTSFVALRALWRWRTPTRDHLTASREWRHWRDHQGRRVAGASAAGAGGTVAVCAAVLVAGSCGVPSLPETAAGAGSLWVGTPDGAARLTTSGWQTFRRPWVPLPASAVHDVAGGPAGEVWLATSGGLLRIGADGSYVRAVVENAPLPYPTVLGVSVDRRGSAWAATVAGAAGLDADREGRAFAGRTAPLMHQLLDTVLVDRRGQVWFGGAGGVNVYEPEAEWSLPGKWPAGFNRWSTSGGLPDNLVFTIVEDRAGRIWFGTGGGAAVLQPDPSAYALGTGEPARWSTFTTSSSGLVNDKVHAIAEDASGRIFFGTEQGVSIYEQPLSGPARWTAIIPDRLPDPHVEAIAVSPDGRVWIGTKAGLAVYDPTTPSALLPVYRSHPLRRWTSHLWPPHAHMDLPASGITALAWIP